MVSHAIPVLDAGAVQPRPAARWSEVAEFLVVGGATLVLLPLSWMSRQLFGHDPAELAVGFLAFHAAFVINDPHFSVTYLLFYRDAYHRAFGSAFAPTQRLRYVVAGAVVPVTLGAWCVAALSADSAVALGWMIQLMFFLVGWHYVKQGFGVLVILSARRKFYFSVLERRLLLGHCLAGWAYAWSSPAVDSRDVIEKGVVYTALAHPAWVESVTGPLFFASAALLGWVVLRRWRRGSGLPPAAPLLGFLSTVWVWTVYSSWDPLMVYVIPALHSAQYLYFVWLMRRNEAVEAEGPPAFRGPARLRLGLLGLSAGLLGWLLFHGAPEFLDGVLVLHDASDPGAVGGLGATPYFAAFFTFVNLHHYFMDAVLWRRDNPETRYLYR